MRIAVVGCGAIGGTVASALAENPAFEVQLCTRTPFAQLTCERPEGTVVLQQAACTDPQFAVRADTVLLCTKAHQCEAALPWLRALAPTSSPQVGPTTQLAILQNGIHHQERVLSVASHFADIVPVVVQLPADHLAPGHVRQRGEARLLVADNAPGRSFASLFARTHIECATTPDLARAAWRKLLWNAPIGGICALANRDTSVLHDLSVRQLARELMLEVCRVARAEGVALEDREADEMLNGLPSAQPGSWPSIAADRREGRAMEWRARNAIVSELSRRHGIATPRNDVIVTLLEAADRAVRRTRAGAAD